MECKTEPLPYAGESHLPHDAGGGAGPGGQTAGQAIMGGMGYDVSGGGYHYYGGCEDGRAAQHGWLGYHHHQVNNIKMGFNDVKQN